MIEFESFLPVVWPAYCEREVFGFEVLNTVSNASFWGAAFAASRRINATRFVQLAGALIVVVGICSALWHWFRAGPLLLLDAVPLYAFILIMAYRVIFLVGGHARASLVTVSILFGAAAANALTVDTALYVPSRHAVALFVLAGAGLWIRARDRRAGNAVLVAIGFYAAGILAKSIDTLVCPLLPIGTHWLWHGCGGAAAYFGLVALNSLEHRHEPHAGEGAVRSR